MATNFKKQPFKPTIALMTFYSPTDSNCLLEVSVWNGMICLNFKRIGRDSNGNYDKEKTDEIKVFLKRTDLTLLSAYIDKLVEERTSQFKNGEIYSKIDEGDGLIIDSKKFNENTGDEYIKHCLKVHTIPDPSGVDRIVLSAQNSKTTIEIGLFNSEDRVKFNKIPTKVVIDMMDIPLFEFGTYLKKQIMNSNITTMYNLGMGIADYIIRQIKGREGKTDYPSSSSDDYTKSSDDFDRGGNSDSFASDDDDRPF